MRAGLFSIVFGTLFNFYLSISMVYAEGDRQDSVAVTQLETYLTQVQENARSDREWGGGILLGLGAASALGGVVTAITGASAEVPISLGVTAVISAGMGAWIRSTPTEQETLPVQFREMPETTSDKVAQKRFLGETYLALLGRQAKRNRLMSSSLDVLLGTAFLGWYAAENQGNNQAANSILLYEGALFSVFGLMGLFIETQVEVGLKNYKLGVFPVPSGGVASLSFSF